MSSLADKPMLTLEPAAIWQQFQLLCDTPRPSYHEALIRDKLITWAEQKKLYTYVDNCGNLLIRKAATIGMETRPTVVLQGHLDIVAQKSSDSDHDFVNDPIRTQIIDGWVTALGTTLGADNGIGVAAALAVLDSDDIAHGPLEAIFTIEEETSLRGASELEEGLLEGKILLNLDSEDRGDVYIGCAGGVDINASKQYTLTETPAHYESVQLTVSGLRGGHSGLDIHKGRGSANVLLARLLHKIDQTLEICICELNGGTLRNAIARDATATIGLAPAQQEALQRLVERQLATYRAELAGIDDNLEIAIAPAQATQRLSAQDQRTLINLLFALPHGVESMSPELPGVTHTSNNLGVITLVEGQLDICLLARSLQDSKTDALADKVSACIALADLEVSFDNAYPGWLPDPNTGLLKQFLDIHRAEMGFDASVKVIHAGLECGIIGAKYPGMEMVSFGPNIRGAHSPDERLEISSVADFWRLLTKLLASL